MPSCTLAAWEELEKAQQNKQSGMLLTLVSCSRIALTCVTWVMVIRCEVHVLYTNVYPWMWLPMCMSDNNSGVMALCGSCFFLPPDVLFPLFLSLQWNRSHPAWAHHLSSGETSSPTVSLPWLPSDLASFPSLL